jgi:hypothetical protein
VLFVTPEGTRIKDRKLARGERGLELILRKTKDKNVLILPLSAIHDTIIPIATDTLVNAGKPFTYAEILAERQENPDLSVIDLMMLRIADILPSKNQGYYKNLLASHPKLRRHPEFAHIERAEVPPIPEIIPRTIKGILRKNRDDKKTAV